MEGACARTPQATAARHPAPPPSPLRRLTRRKTSFTPPADQPHLTSIIEQPLAGADCELHFIVPTTPITTICSITTDSGPPLAGDDAVLDYCRELAQPRAPADATPLPRLHQGGRHPPP